MRKTSLNLIFTLSTVLIVVLLTLAIVTTLIQKNDTTIAETPAIVESTADTNDETSDDKLVVLPEEKENKDVTIENNDTTTTLPEEDKSDEQVKLPENSDSLENEITTTPAEPEITIPETGEENNAESSGTDDDVIIIVDTNKPIIDKSLGFTVNETYKNSMADGSGTMLWNLDVSYNQLSAGNLLEQNGLYLVFRSAYSADGENTSNWYTFAHAFYNDEAENYTSTGYMNKYIYSIQFAVVDVAPNDTEFGGYDDVQIEEDNIIAISAIYYNQYFAA
jgi:hypothetical protein